MAFIEPFPYYPVKIAEMRAENERTRTIVIEGNLPWTFQAGQHCVLRLTDDDGYIAARDYSISSAPSSGKIELTVLKTKGEVSTWVHERLHEGEQVLVSNPLGKDFSWDTRDTAPILLLAGGIGVAPLMSIWREHRLQDAASPIRLAYSVRTRQDICFSDDLVPRRELERVQIWLTREPKGDEEYLSGRITAETLRPLLVSGQKVYICGPTSFVDAMEKLVHFGLDVPVEAILTERFG